MVRGCDLFMSQIETGNLNKKTLENPETRGWVLGNFIDLSLPFHSKDVEIKWGRHKKGETKDSAYVDVPTKALAILIYGKLSIKFPEQDQDIVLEKEGDYIYNEGRLHHILNVFEDSLLITIRWPSLKA